MNEVISFNLNYDMTLELTPEGKDVYDDYRLRDDADTGFLPQIKEGKVRLQTWRVMAIFGHELGRLNRVFDMNVQLHPSSDILKKPLILNP